MPTIKLPRGVPISQLGIKFTDRNRCTRGKTKWKVGQTKTITARGPVWFYDRTSLCNPAWFHFYSIEHAGEGDVQKTIAHAIRIDPYHGEYTSMHGHPKRYRLWLVRVGRKQLHEDGKSGARSMTLLRELPKPRRKRGA